MLRIHPQPGTILICDFAGLREPEMTKRRPVVVVSPRFRSRGQLCTVVPLSTSPPRPAAEYNCTLTIDPPLPDPYSERVCWVKADMLYTVAFHRLSLPLAGKDGQGKRLYDVRHLADADLARVQECVLKGLGLPLDKGPPAP